MTFDQHKPVWEPAHLWLLENTKSDEQKAQAFLESSPPETQASMPWGKWGTASFRDREGTGVSKKCSQSEWWSTTFCMPTALDGLQWTAWSIHFSIFLTDYPFLSYLEVGFMHLRCEPHCLLSQMFSPRLLLLYYLCLAAVLFHETVWLCCQERKFSLYSFCYLCLH